jgi:hypothetical protein
VKLPVPCAPGEEKETEAGGGASGERPGNGGTSGVGAPCAPALSDRRAGLSFLSRPRSGRTCSRPRASPAAVTPGGGSSRAPPRADAAAAACGWVTGAWQLALREQLCGPVFGTLSGLIACGITRCFGVILREIFFVLFGAAAGVVVFAVFAAGAVLCGSASWVWVLPEGVTTGGGGGGGGDTGSGITGVTTGTETVGGTIGVGGAAGTTGVDSLIATAAIAAPSTGTAGTPSASAFGTRTAATRTAPITAACRRALAGPRILRDQLPRTVQLDTKNFREIFRERLEPSTIDVWRRRCTRRTPSGTG